MKISAFTLAMCGAWVAQTHSIALLNAYYAGLVFLSLMMCFFGRGKDHFVVGMVLFASYVVENNSIIWHDSPGLLAAIYAAFALLVFNIGGTIKGEYAAIYLTKSLVAVAFYGSLIESYPYHLALNVISVYALISLAVLGYRRSVGIKNGASKDDLGPMLMVPARMARNWISD